MKNSFKNLCEKIIIHRNLLLVIAFITFLSFALRDFIANIFNQFWVDPIISKIYGYSAWVFIFFFIILSLYYFASFKEERYKSKRRIWILGISIGLYLLSILYSIKEGQGWTYASINDSNCFITFYFTLLSIVPIIGELALFNKTKNIKSKPDEECSLILECPIKSKENDSYRRNEYCRTIAQKIKNNFHKRGSFVYGIYGEWGTGKTSLFNLLKSHLKDESQIIQFDFNPWKSSAHSDIITNFFSLLSKELSSKIPHFDNKLINYAEAVSEMNANSFFENCLKIMRPLLFESISVRYNEISKILEESKIKILIFIDDLDRLSKEEILEVFRLVRNTSNFPYLQFVIAYDRNYIIKTIELPNSDKYLQKILNLEISLSKFNPNLPIESLNNRINNKKDINKVSKDKIGEFLSNAKYDDENTFPVKYIIKTRRDEIRFFNSLIINIEAIKKVLGINFLTDINIIDLVKIELIRYVNPDYCNKIAEDPLSELEIDNNQIFKYKKKEKEGIDNKREESINDIDDEIIDPDSFFDEKIHNDRVFIKKEDLLTVCMSNLFPQDSTNDATSITHIRSFDQYFSYRYDEKNISVMGNFEAPFLGNVKTPQLGH